MKWEFGVKESHDPAFSPDVADGRLNPRLVKLDEDSIVYKDLLLYKTIGA